MTIVEGRMDPTPAEPDKRRGRIGRLTATIMGAGATTAVGLCVTAFEAASEPVITGVVLLVFAASWATLAAVSRRRTDQPQRWARVPAVIMGTLGAVCLLLRPSVDTMRVAGWVWPLGLIGLACWMIVQSRRSLRSWARRAVLYPIFTVMILGGIAAAAETVLEAHDRSSYAMPGDLVDVGGYRLHIHCTGTGSPTVILEAGLGEPSAIMAGWIAPDVAATTRVCVYDRAGKGWSDPAPESRDGIDTARDLHFLLKAHGETGPFVLAGHSSGGVYVQAYAATYPDDVAGVVLIDSQPADALTRLPGYDTVYSGFRMASGLAPSLARFGIMRVINASAAGSIPDPQRSEERAFGSTADQSRSMRDEIAALPSAMTLAQSLTSLGTKPLIVLTAEKDALDGWLPLQAEMTALSSNSVQRLLPDATHASLVETEGGAESSARAISDVVQAVRLGSTVPIR